MNKDDILKAINFFDSDTEMRPLFNRTVPDFAIDCVQLAINALQAQLNDGWIDVNEKLPNPNTPILFEVICDMHQSDFYGIYKGIYNDETFWVEDEEHKELCGCTADLVLRWRYSPEPPKGE